MNLAQERPYVVAKRYTRQEILDCIHSRDPEWMNGLLNAHGTFLQKAGKILRERMMDCMLKEAVENSFGKYPENIPMTQEMLVDFLKELEKEFIPWIASIIDVGSGQ